MQRTVGHGAPHGALLVKRSLRPGAPGTIKLLREHGSALVCVRYRENETQTMRVTTVELVVERRPGSAALVSADLPWNNRSLRQKAQQLGAKWNARRRVWTMTLAAAKRLKIHHTVELLRFDGGPPQRRKP